MELRHHLMTTTIKTPCFYYRYSDIASKIQPEAAEMLKQAEHYWEQQDVRQATEYYKKALEKTKPLGADTADQQGSPFLAINFGTILAEQGLVNEGIEELRSVIESDRVGSNIAGYNIGTILLSHGAIKQALEYFEKAYDLDPHNVNIMNNLALAYWHLHQEDKSSYYLKKALDERPTFDYAAHNLGCIAYERNDLAQATEWFEKARTLNPDNFATLNNLACTLFLSDHIKKAVSLLYECIKLNPYYRMPYYNLGFIVYEKKLVDSSFFKE